MMLCLNWNLQTYPSSWGHADLAILWWKLGIWGCLTYLTFSIGIIIYLGIASESVTKKIAKKAKVDLNMLIAQNELNRDTFSKGPHIGSHLSLEHTGRWDEDTILAQGSKLVIELQRNKSLT